MIFVCVKVSPVHNESAISIHRLGRELSSSARWLKKQVRLHSLFIFYFELTKTVGWSWLGERKWNWSAVGHQCKGPSVRVTVKKVSLLVQDKSLARTNDNCSLIASHTVAHIFGWTQLCNLNMHKFFEIVPSIGTFINIYNHNLFQRSCISPMSMSWKMLAMTGRKHTGARAR